MMDPSSRRGAIRAPLVLTSSASPPARRDALDRPTEIRDAALAWQDGILTYVGAASGLDPRQHGSVHDARGATIVPGFVDAHTHLPFVGWRAEEYEMRIAGRTYRDLHGEGGIPRSARQLAAATDEDVLAFCAPLLREMLDHGTTALELKTGYGLSVDGELRQARIARRLAERAPQTCTVTLLACHAVPEGVDRRSWVETVCSELVPLAATERLVDAVDVYVEDIAFDLDDLRSVARAADRASLPLRVHADQLGSSSAAEAAVALGARTADHLNHTGSAGVRALGGGATAAVLLPASTFVLGAPLPPVRDLVEAGAPVVIATDLNPGTSPTASMPEAMAIACTLYRLSPREALVAATANAAWALGLHGRLGGLDVGKRADFLVLDASDIREVPYRPGHNPVVDAYVGGMREGGR
jgi:imidazolonepropionase